MGEISKEDFVNKQMSAYLTDSKTSAQVMAQLQYVFRLL